MSRGRSMSIFMYVLGFADDPSGNKSFLGRGAEVVTPAFYNRLGLDEEIVSVAVVAPPAGQMTLKAVATVAVSRQRTGCHGDARLVQNEITVSYSWRRDH